MAQKSCLITQKCASQLVHFLLEPFPCHHGLNEKHTSCITEYIFQSKHNDLRAFAYIFSRLKPYYNITGILRSSCMRSSGFKRMFITWIRAVASASSGKVELKISWKCFLRRRRSWICGRNMRAWGCALEMKEVWMMHLAYFQSKHPVFSQLSSIMIGEDEWVSSDIVWRVVVNSIIVTYICGGQYSLDRS